MLRIGSGAGFAGDRIEPALALVADGNLDYLILEGLAERTIALAQQQKRRNPQYGYNEYLEERMRRLLPLLLEKKVRLITNMGAANPTSAAKKIVEIANSMGLPCKVAAVTGDNVLEKLNRESKAIESGKPLHNYEPIISANAYLGIEALLPALATDVNIIVTGRVADPSLFLAPIVHHYNWDLENDELLGQGTLVGHLLECAGQVTGGYFADPGRKDVKGLANLGFPYAIIEPNGDAIITKLENTGGTVSLGTVKEQLLYEVHDPKNYVTPDCVADFSSVKLKEIGPNQILVHGATGKRKPKRLKVSVGYQAGYLGEGEISYGGSTAVTRAELAKQILEERLQHNVPLLHIDLMGVDSLHQSQFGSYHPYEVRVRVSALCRNIEEAKIIGHEVESLYTNGPSGGGGARKRVEEVIGIISTFIQREDITVKTEIWSDSHVQNKIG